MASTKEDAVALTKEDEEELMEVNEDVTDPEGPEEERMSDAETEEQELPPVDGKVRNARRTRKGVPTVIPLLRRRRVKRERYLTCLSGSRLALVDGKKDKRSAGKAIQPQKTLPKTQKSTVEREAAELLGMPVLFIGCRRTNRNNVHLSDLN